MRERKYVKLKVNMYDDTKSKIIDMKPERDLIHYAWTRIVVLAGKVNLEGDLYLSRNIPYTVETLAIEFNREANQIKLALDVFMELEMIELTENNVYRVKNFAKHQNLKVKETVNTSLIGNEDSNNLDNTICDEKSNNNLKTNMPIVLAEKKNKGSNNKKNENKNKNKNNIYMADDQEENEDDRIMQFFEGDEERPLKEGETVTMAWSFK